MAKKKSALDAMQEGSFNPQKAATEVTKEDQKESKSNDSVGRKMIRVTPIIHAMAKKTAVNEGKTLQSVIEDLVHEHVKKTYPEMYKYMMDELKDNDPDTYIRLLSQAKRFD